VGIILRVFSDEAGQAPQHDDDETFVAAAYLALGDSPSGLPIGATSSPSDTVRHLRAIQAEPRCWYVKPGPGYREKLLAKYGAMDVMARYRNLQRGGGYALGSMSNWIWAEIMAVAGASTAAVAISRVALYGAAHGELLQAPDRIHICFHQHSAKRPVFDVKRLAIQNITQVVRSTAAGSVRFLKREDARRRLLEFSSTFSVAPDAVTVEWSHDNAHDPATGAHNPQAGPLWLAHSLAKYFYRALRKRDPIPQFIDMLKEGGYEYNTAIDFTPQLLAGLARRSVEHWSRSTGFPVPAGTPIEDDDQRPPRRIS